MTGHLPLNSRSSFLSPPCSARILLSLVKAISAGIDWPEVPMYLCGVAGRVCIRVSCHFRAQPHRAAREIRRILLLLLGRGSVDADPVPDLVRCYGSMASTNKRKSTASAPWTKKDGRRSRLRPSGARSAQACALVLALLTVLCCFQINAAFLNLLTSVFRGLIGAGFYILPFSFIMSFLILVSARRPTCRAARDVYVSDGRTDRQSGAAGRRKI